MAGRGLKGVYAAPALEKAFEIIELLAEHPEGALVSEMAAGLGRSVGELFRVVIVLERLGYLRKSAVSDRYTVTYRLLELAYRATPAQNLVRAAGPEMQALVMKAGQSCHLVTPSGGHGLVVAGEQHPGMRGFSVKIGATVDLVRSCSGHVLLAFSSPQRAEDILAEAEQELGEPVDRDAIAKRLKVVRGQGYDRRKSPITYGVTDLSYPVYGFDGTVVAALTIPFLELIDGSQKVGLDAAQEMLREAVARISDRLGRPATEG